MIEHVVYFTKNSEIFHMILRTKYTVVHGCKHSKLISKELTVMIEHSCISPIMI